MREKYSFRAETKTTYTSALSIRSIQTETQSQKMLDFDAPHPLERLVVILDKKTKNKKRYYFQILKQFYLFPDSSVDSSLSNVSQYYAVLTGEEKLHSLYKLLETQMIETKIWAFLNLRHWKKARRIAQAVPICDRITQKKQMGYKFEGFYAIKQKSNEQTQILSHQRLLNITIVNQTPKKSVKNESINKSEYNFSRQTQIDSFAYEKSMHNRYQYNEVYPSNNCEQCYCTGTCCCYAGCNYKRKGYNLQERMEYLRMLEDMARQYDVQ